MLQAQRVFSARLSRTRTGHCLGLNATIAEFHAGHRAPKQFAMPAAEKTSKIFNRRASGAEVLQANEGVRAGVRPLLWVFHLSFWELRSSG